MKKKLLAITAALLLIASTTFANESKPIPTTIINQLHQEFESATEVAWKTTADFYKASFTADGQSLEAFFSPDGQLLGTSRKLTVDQLPLAVIKETSKLGSANEVTELFELSSDRGTEYFITFGSGKEAKTYKSAGTSWNRFTPGKFNDGI